MSVKPCPLGRGGCQKKDDNSYLLEVEAEIFNSIIIKQHLQNNLPLKHISKKIKI